MQGMWGGSCRTARGIEIGEVLGVGQERKKRVHI